MRRQSSSAEEPSATEGVPVAWTFFRQWLKNPLAVAALSPSSRQLAQQMIAQLLPTTRRVIELGGGTGVFTRALLNHGIAPADLLVLEVNEQLYQLLHHRFPGVTVVCGDARELRAHVRRSRFAARGPADAVLSGLGLLSMSRPTQRVILEASFASMDANGRFIQFTYGPANPVSRELLNQIGLTVRRAGVAWVNMPPATVYVYARSHTRSIRAIRSAPPV
ncbi:MAG: phospholipid methyltransferase [Rhodanobacteraceae bacterium]